MLEVAATEFECQGLELDWTGICWGGDFLICPETGQWRFQKFLGFEVAASKTGEGKTIYREQIPRPVDACAAWDDNLGAAWRSARSNSRSAVLRRYGCVSTRTGIAGGLRHHPNVLREFRRGICAAGPRSPSNCRRLGISRLLPQREVQDRKHEKNGDSDSEDLLMSTARSSEKKRIKPGTPTSVDSIRLLKQHRGRSVRTGKQIPCMRSSCAASLGNSDYGIASMPVTCWASRTSFSAPQES